MPRLFFSMRGIAFAAVPVSFERLAFLRGMSWRDEARCRTAIRITTTAHDVRGGRPFLGLEAIDKDVRSLNASAERKSASRCWKKPRSGGGGRIDGLGLPEPRIVHGWRQQDTGSDYEQ
jgi:hypothetical protein